MPRVLHIISSAGMYGAENSLLQAMRYTPGTEESVAVFSRQQTGSPTPALVLEAEKQGYLTCVLPHKNDQTVKAFSLLSNFIKVVKPDIIHTHGYKELVYGLLSARYHRRKLIHTNHGFVDNNKIKKKGYHLLEMILCRYLRNMPVIVLSESTKERFTAFGVPQGRVTVIQNSIHPDSLPQDIAAPDDLKGLLDKRQPLAFVGRLSHEKGPDTLLTAMPKVISSFSNVILLIAGEGYQRQMLEQMVKSLGIGEHVIFLGFRDDAEAIIANCIGVVVPSRNEAIPRTLMEAMLLGRPVIATAVGGIPEVIVDGVSGILVAPDAPAEIAAGISQLLHNANYRETLGQEARLRIITDFNAQVRCEELAYMYSSLSAL